MEDNLILGHCRRPGTGGLLGGRLCRFCREHLERAEARRLRALDVPGLHWETKIGAGLDVLSYWPPGGIPDSTRAGQGIRYMKEPRPDDHPAGRRKIRPMLARGVPR